MTAGSTVKPIALEWKTVKRRVPEGTILGPLLLLWYVSRLIINRKCF